MSDELWCADRLVAGQVRRVTRAADRARGLLGLHGLPAGHALILDPARQVHTLGMRFPIDVAFCDRNGEVLHVVHGLAPWRLTRFVRRAGFVVEMAAGGLAGLTRGNRLETRSALDQGRSSNPVS